VLVFGETGGQTKRQKISMGYCSDTVVVYKEWAFIERTLKYIALSTNFECHHRNWGPHSRPAMGSHHKKHQTKID
jgi:hypothetical protein